MHFPECETIGLQYLILEINVFIIFAPI